MKNYADIIKNSTIITPKTILEIGSRDGDDANRLKEYLNLLDEDIFVVEPNPHQQIKISKKYPKFNLINNAIFNETKTLSFNAVTENNEVLVGVSSLLNRVDGLYEKIESEKIFVDAILGKDLLIKIGKNIDVCKIDVEGATYEVLESFGDEIKKIKIMHIECEHKEVWDGQKLYDDIKNLLESKDFVQIYFQYVNNVKLQSDSIWLHKNYIK
jgi:FkbM family methyltransferase